MKKERKTFATGHKPRKHTIVFGDKRNKRSKDSWKKELE